MSSIQFTARPRRPRWHVPVAITFVLATVTGGMVDGLGTAAAATSSLGGVAFHDADRDGMLDGDETVLAGDRIALYSASGSVGTTVTDEAGRYAFTGLASGTYRVAYDNQDWWEIWGEWVPTTLATLRPSVTLDVAGDTTVDFGWRRIVRTTDTASPIDVFAGPTGLRVEVYNDVVSARDVHDRLAAGLIGEEAASTTVRVDISDSSTTSTSIAREDGVYTRFSAIAYISWMSWLQHPDQTLGHEYGHVWTLYHAYLTQQDRDFGAYLEARGLANDDRVGSSYLWSPRELAAEDYRQLLGAPAGRSAPQANSQVADADDVPGLEAFLRDDFTTPPDGGVEPVPEPTSDPTAEPSPAPAPSEEDVAAPTPTLLSPDDGATLPDGAIDVTADVADTDTSVTELDVVGELDGVIYPARFDTATGRFTFAMDATGLKGTYELTVRATDPAGNVGVDGATVEFVRSKPGNGGSKDDDKACKGRWC